jgi:phospholipid/cholesterol/gamma-HCH transport system permease protein
VRLLPMVSFVAMVLGLVVIGQTVSMLNRYAASAQDWAGVVMVSVIVRELGPLVTAFLVLARIGTVIVIELSTNRATGEVEALEALGIDPIHFLVMPRVLGLAAAIFSLTVYMIIVALFSGYLFAFLQDVPISPAQYLNQLISSLRWEDFALLALKTISFGSVIATVTCFHGLARPVRLEEVGQVTSNAVVSSVIACVLLDALFIIVYLVI